LISNVAANVAAYPAHFCEVGRTPTDVIMALTCSDVFLRIWADIIKASFNPRVEGSSPSGPT
jgi:hypothetical protein